MAATTALYVRLATPEACPADRLRFELIEAPASTTLEISNPVRQPIIYKTISNTDKYSVRSGYGVLAIGGQKELRFTMVDAARQDILASAEEGLVLSNDRFGVVFAAVGPDLAQFLETQKGQVLKECINSIFAQKEQFPSRCEMLSVTLVVPPQDNTSPRPAKKPRQSAQPSEVSITTSRAGSAPPPTAGGSSSSESDDGGRGQVPSRPKARPAAPPTAGGSSSDSDSRDGDASHWDLVLATPPPPQFYTIANVEQLGQGALSRDLAEQLRNTWCSCVEVTSKYDGFGTVALRRLEPGRLLLDATAAYSPLPPPPKLAGRCLKIQAPGAPPCFFLVDSIRKDRTGAVAASSLINQAEHDRDGNVTFTVQGRGRGQPSILGLEVVKVIPPGAELLLLQPPPIGAADDIEADSSSEDDDDNNDSTIDYASFWDLRSARALLKFFTAKELRKVLDDRRLPVVTGKDSKAANAKTLLTHISSHQMPGARVAPRKERVAQEAARLCAKMSKIKVQHSGDTETLGRALIFKDSSKAASEERIRMIEEFGKEVQRIRHEEIGVEETPDSDAEGLDTQDEVMLATRNAGPFLVTGAVGGIGKKPLARLHSYVETKIKSEEPIFSVSLPHRYTEALCGHVDAAQRGKFRGFAVAYVNYEDTRKKAASRRTGAIVEYDASQVPRLIRYARRLLRDAQDPTKKTTVEDDRRGAILFRFLTVANRDDSEASDKFTVVPATLDQVRDKIRAFEAEVAEDGQTLELLTPEEYLDSQNHLLWLTDTSKASSNGQPITNNGVYAVSYSAYGPQRLNILLRDLQYAFDMDQGSQDDFTENRSWVRNLIVTEVFAGKKPWEMDGVAQSSLAKFERTMIITLNMMIPFKDRNTRFNRRRTSHRLSLVQNGDYIAGDVISTDHAYNWLKPYWPRGTADDPELPRTFTPEQA